jgi:hypothetical protein
MIRAGGARFVDGEAERIDSWEPDSRRLMAGSFPLTSP